MTAAACRIVAYRTADRNTTGGSWRHPCQGQRIGAESTGSADLPLPAVHKVVDDKGEAASRVDFLEKGRVKIIITRLRGSKGL